MERNSLKLSTLTSKSLKILSSNSRFTIKALTTKPSYIRKSSKTLTRRKTFKQDPVEPPKLLNLVVVGSKEKLGVMRSTNRLLVQTPKIRIRGQMALKPSLSLLSPCCLKRNNPIKLNFICGTEDSFSDTDSHLMLESKLT